MDSTISPYKIIESETYNIIDTSSDSFNNQKNIDYLKIQAEEYASGDIMKSPSNKDLILGPNIKIQQNGNGLKEYRIKINSKGYKIMGYNEIDSIKKIYKKYNKSKDYLIKCNDVLYKGTNGKIIKLY